MFCCWICGYTANTGVYIPWARVWNFAETSIKMLPTYERGWSEKGKDSKRRGDNHANLTLTLMCGTQTGDLLEQLIFKGKTARVLPDVAPFDSLQLTMTENHWCDIDTVMQSVAMMDCKINAETPRHLWLVVLDVCPVHVSKATRVELASKFPWIRSTYVLPGMTSVAQPADAAFMAPLKECLRRITSPDLSRLILDAIDAGASLQEALRRSVLKPKVVRWIETAMLELTAQGSHL